MLFRSLHAWYDLYTEESKAQNSYKERIKINQKVFLKYHPNLHGNMRNSEIHEIIEMSFSQEMYSLYEID